MYFIFFKSRVWGVGSIKKRKISLLGKFVHPCVSYPAHVSTKKNMFSLKGGRAFTEEREFY